MFYGKTYSILSVKQKMDELAADLSLTFDMFARASLDILPDIVAKAIYDICLVYDDRLESAKAHLTSLCYPHNDAILTIYRHYLFRIYQARQAIFIDDAAQDDISPSFEDASFLYTSFALLPIYTNTDAIICIGIFFDEKHAWTYQERYELLFFMKIFSENIHNHQTMQNTLSIRQGHEDALIALRHDLHTPLTSIQGYLELASRKIAQGTRESQISRYLDIALQETQTLQTRLEELLNLSMIDLNCFELSVSSLSPDTLIGAVIMEYSLHYPYRTIVADVPDSRHMATWDAERIKQILSHLLRNALMYSPDTSPVEIQVRYSEEGVSIAVQDYGDGIEASKQDLIFVRYWRGVDNSFRKTSYGLGIGLYLSRAFAEYHGGRLWVESSAKAGEGSRFVLDLPWQAVEGAAETGPSV